MAPIGEIADVLLAGRMRELDVDMSRDVLAEEWLLFHPRLPAPSVFTEARQYRSQSELLSLIRRLAFEGKIAGYAEGRNFATLARWMTRSEVA